MTTLYKPLFSVRVTHAYFTDGVCRSMSLAPTARGMALLSRYDCLFRPDAQGGSVYAPSSPRWKSVAELQPLSFCLTRTGGSLASFTDTGSHTEPPDATVYSYNNLTDFGTDSSTDSSTDSPIHLLHPKNKPFASEPLRTYTPRFTYALKPKQDSAKLVLADAVGNIVWKPATPTPGLTRITVDLSSLPEGRYQMRCDGADPDDIYITTAPAAAVWAFIDIYPSHLPPAAQLHTDFGIALATRASVWRYYIVSQSPDRTYQDYSISFNPALNAPAESKLDITFSAPTATPVNGQPAWVFESEQPIPLYQYPGNHFAVTLTTKGKSIPLPFAQPATTRLDRKPKGTLRYCSEIFVYL